MSFDKVPGNAPIKEILRSALRRRSVLPSLLFCGAEGAGQRETALELAKAFNCGRLEDEACDECPSCKSIEAGNHPDVIEVKNLPRSESEENEESAEAEDEDEGAEEEDPGKKSSMIYIRQMRRAGELARMKPMIGRRRVFLVDDAGQMNEATANASLKILEEPPDFVQFILITANPDLLLPTILSRCRMLTFGAVGSEDIAATLRARGEDEARAAVIAAIVRGNYHRALTEDWDAYFERRREAWDWYRMILSGPNGTDFVRKLTGGRKPASRDDVAGLLAFFRGFGRDLLLFGETGRGGGLLNPDLEPEIRDAAANVEPERALRLIRAVETASSGLDAYANVRLIVSVLFARMTG